MITYRICRWYGNISDSKSTYWEYSSVEDAIKLFLSEKNLGANTVTDFEIRKDGKILVVFN